MNVPYREGITAIKNMVHELKNMMQLTNMTSYEKETAVEILDEFVHYIVTRERQQ